MTTINVFSLLIAGSKVWMMGNKVPLDKKGTGIGANCSAGTSEVYLEGLTPGPDVIRRVNADRVDRCYRALPEIKCRKLGLNENVFQK